MGKYRVMNFIHKSKKPSLRIRCSLLGCILCVANELHERDKPTKNISIFVR